MDNTKKILKTRKISTTTTIDLWDGVGKRCWPICHSTNNLLYSMFIYKWKWLRTSFHWTTIITIVFIMCGVKLHLEYVKWQINIMDERLHMIIKKCQNFRHLVIMWNMKV
jgi:hypothetical protein